MYIDFVCLHRTSLHNIIVNIIIMFRMELRLFSKPHTKVILRCWWNYSNTNRTWAFYRYVSDTWVTAAYNYSITHFTQQKMSCSFYLW